MSCLEQQFGGLINGLVLLLDWSYYWTGLNIKLLQNGGLNTVFWDILVSYFRHFGSDGYSFILASVIFANSLLW